MDDAQAQAAGTGASLALSFFALAMIMGLVGMSGRARRPSMLILVFMPLLAGGILLIPFLASGSQLVSSTLIATARNLFSIYLYYVIALVVARRGHGAFAVGVTVGVGDLGHVVGSTLGPALLTGAGQQVLVVCVVIAYLVFISSTLLFYPFAFDRGRLAVDLAAPAADASRVDDARRPGSDPFDEAGAAMGLSRRERDILPLLLSSRTMIGIADELGISYNTAKTHAAHVFRKVGVRSREELARWFEGRSGKGT